jgi:hypothetical protein
MSAMPSAPIRAAVSPALLDADERLHALDILRGLALFPERAFEMGARRTFKLERDA